MYQVITVGSALVDIFIHSDQFVPTKSKQGDLLCQVYGDKTEVDGFNVFTGGGGGNTAAGFARLGFKTAAICETGRDGFARLVMQDFDDQQVSTQLVIEEKKEQTGGSIILVGPDGERTVLVHRGAASMLDPFDISAYWLSEARHVHLSSLGGQRPTLEKIFKLVTRNPDLSLSWNPGKKELALLANRQLVPVDIPCQVFIVNQSEWRIVSDLQETILNAFDHVVVTAAGKGGDIYYRGEHLGHYSALSTNVVDATGAGDAFAVGYIAGILWGRKPELAAEYGAKNAASVVAHYGAKTGLLYQEDLVAKKIKN